MRKYTAHGFISFAPIIIYASTGSERDQLISFSVKFRQFPHKPTIWRLIVFFAGNNDMLVDVVALDVDISELNIVVARDP